MKSRKRDEPAINLSPLDEDELATILAWRNNPEIYQWCRQYEPISWESHSAWFKRIQGDASIKMFGIYTPGLVGVCGLTSIDWVNRRAEFSLYVGPEYKGLGYGEAALRGLIRHGFDVLGLNSIWGEVFAGNPAMEMFRKVGFKDEGVRRQFYYRKGKFIDAYLCSIQRGS